MSDRYTIGDIAKLFDIPMQNIRFYEEKGIITPEKNKSNGYRSYSAWTLNDLLDTKRFRGMDFSLEQIGKILKTNNLNEICDTYITQEQKILKEIQRYQIILEILSKERIKIQTVKQFVGTFKICKSPALVFHRFRKKNKLQDMSGNTDLKNLHSELSDWLQLSPEPTIAFYVPFQSLCGTPINKIEYWYGYSIECEKALQYGIKTEAPNEYLESCRSVYTIFEAHDEGTFMDAFYHQVYEKITSEGLVVCGSPRGRLIIKSHEEDHYTRYFETWVPILS